MASRPTQRVLPPGEGLTAACIRLTGIATRGCVGVSTGSAGSRVTRAGVAVAGAIIPALTIIAGTAAVIRSTTTATSVALAVLATTATTAIAVNATAISVIATTTLTAFITTTATATLLAVLAAVATVVTVVASATAAATTIAAIITAIVATVVATVITAVATLAATVRIITTIAAATVATATVTTTTTVVKAATTTTTAGVTLGRAKVLARGRGAGTDTARLLNVKGAALDDLAAQALYGCIGHFGSDHLDEAETTRLARVRVLHDLALLHLTVLLEQASNLGLLQTRVDARDEEVRARVVSTIVILVAAVALDGSTIVAIRGHGATTRVVAIVATRRRTTVAIVTRAVVIVALAGRFIIHRRSRHCDGLGVSRN